MENNQNNSDTKTQIEPLLIIRYHQTDHTQCKETTTQCGAVKHIPHLVETSDQTLKKQS